MVLRSHLLLFFGAKFSFFFYAASPIKSSPATNCLSKFLNKMYHCIIVKQWSTVASHYLSCSKKLGIGQYPVTNKLTVLIMLASLSVLLQNTTAEKGQPLGTSLHTKGLGARCVVG
jgi:hypothetical protein